MQTRSLSTAGWLLALLSQLIGCGEVDYPLVPVSGAVTLDGEPLSGAAVVFQPTSTGSAGKTAPGSVGRTNGDGRYELSTVNDQPGASPGRHKIRIYSHSPESAPVSDTDSGENSERVPDRFNYRSQLFFEVPSTGTDAADFQLTTDFKE
ncbi:MAG: hypothetical protein ACR2NM_14990 [Bythopirellula sp.]